MRVILDVERAGVPIRGSLVTARGVERRFHGWLELADALETARAGEPGKAVASALQAAEGAAVVRIS